MTDLILPWSSDYADYLRDESRRMGTAASISFPTAEADVVEVMGKARASGGTITTQGARTGIVAGAVPDGGHILNLSRMNAIGEIHQGEATGGHLITVQPGATLEAIQKAVGRRGLFFPPDPTETTASIGGMVACNASGALSFSYGSTRKWVESIRLVMSGGDTLCLKRGENRASGRSFSLTTESRRVIAGQLPSYAMPNVKSAAGYFVSDDMDLLDLFIGMEGTLGVITEIELRLIPKPTAVNALTVFLPSEEAALKLVRILRGEPVEGFTRMSVRPVAIEFFNSNSLDLLRRMKSENTAFEKIPALKPHFHTAIATEFHARSDDDLEEAIVQVTDVLSELGVSDDDTWFATTDREMEPLKAFRHATPEAVNLLIDERRKSCPELTKLGTDMSVPNSRLDAVLAMYNADLKESGLESVIFGHIGDNHVHVNVLPNSIEEYEKGRSLYLSWAGRVIEMGGSISAEHGIGKTKTAFLEMMYGTDAVAEMKALKKLFDPEMMLGPGNLF